MGNLKRVLGAAALLQALAAVPALAQEFHGHYGVFEGYVRDQAVVHTSREEAHWLVDQYTRFGNGRPSPGDWVHVEVDSYGRAVDFVVEEHPARRSATVDHLEGPTVVVRTNYGVEMWNEVATTWRLGVAPGGLMPGDSIDVGVFRNRNLAYVRLDSRANMALPPPPEFAPEAPPADAGPPPADEVPPDGGDAVQAQVAPPPLPVYDVPPCPEPDYIWTPGYWHWGPAGYYWVPGVWVAPPAVGLLWTPGYWGFFGGLYVFHAGYWGPHVGFYGGVVYGGGYYGEGFVGGRWEGGHMAYNTAAVSVNTTIIHNTYVNNTVVINNQTTTINNVTNNVNRMNNVSYSGGAGGARATPTATEQGWANEAHLKPTPVQLQHISAARSNPQLQHSFNQGRPPVLAAPRPMAAPHAPGSATKAGGPVAGAPTRTGQPQGQPQGHPQPMSESRGATPLTEATRPPVTQSRPGEAHVRPQPQPQPQPQPHPQPQLQPQPQPHPQPQSRPDSLGQPRPETQARPQAQPHAVTAPEKRGEGKENEERR